MKIKKYSILILSFIVVSALVLNSCGKTSKDREWEESIRGYWYPVDANGKRYEYMPSFIFNDNKRGASSVKWDSEACDSFGWEIVRKQLTLIYDNAPKYEVGYDKYNRKALFKINSFNNDKISVIQLTNGNLQREYSLVRGKFSELENEIEEKKLYREQNMR